VRGLGAKSILKNRNQVYKTSLRTAQGRKYTAKPEKSSRKYSKTTTQPRKRSKRSRRYTDDDDSDESSYEPEINNWDNTYDLNQRETSKGINFGRTFEKSTRFLINEIDKGQSRGSK
jgi:hypothetical protein